VDKIFDVATSISTPLALGGFLAAVVFWIFRQIIAKDIFPRLTESLGADVIKHIVDRLFILALVATVLGISAYVFVIVIQKDDNSRKQASSSDGVPPGRLLSAAPFRARLDDCTDKTCDVVLRLKGYDSQGRLRYDSKDEFSKWIQGDSRDTRLNTTDTLYFDADQKVHFQLFCGLEGENLRVGEGSDLGWSARFESSTPGVFYWLSCAHDHFKASIGIAVAPATSRINQPEVKDDSSPPQADVQAASRPAVAEPVPTSSRQAASGSFSTGNGDSFVQAAPGVWHELSPQKTDPSFIFEETKRTDTELLLFDKSRSLYLRLPIPTGIAQWRVGDSGSWNYWYAATYHK